MAPGLSQTIFSRYIFRVRVRVGVRVRVRVRVRLLVPGQDRFERNWVVRESRIWTIV